MHPAPDLHVAQNIALPASPPLSPPAIPTQDPELNPWQDAPKDAQPAHEDGRAATHPILVPDLAALDPATAQGLAAAEHKSDGADAAHETMHVNTADVLHEFDPLAVQEEKAAKEAWENAESHPPVSPPPPPPETPHKSTEGSGSGGESGPPAVPTKTVEEPARPSSPMSSFPSLAALARTFALPLTSRQRPRSLDSATAVPSPATLSSFASQQQAGRSSESGSAPGSGASTPTSRAGRSNDGDPPQFDFQRFLEQMKSKSAEPVAKYLRSFLSNFAKRTFTVTDQVKLINDFLNFISVKMREADIWRNAPDAEFENAMEGMEKLVMNRLYDYTFTPQVARMIPPRPVTSDDLERDRVLSQRISLFKWVEPGHLDVPEGPGSEGFLMFAQQELLKLNHYKAPRDKLICILNCCKVIFGLIRHLQKDESADSFIPILIYVVLKANPEHLLSNVEFINRFRNPTKLQSEAGYYLSSLMGAVSFIETMDHSSLSNITQEEFEKNVEDAIQSLPNSAVPSPQPGTPQSANASSHSLPLPSTHMGEESAQPLALPVPVQTFSEDAKRLLQKTGDTISKPLSAIGRLLVEAEESLASLTPFDIGKELTDSRPSTPSNGDYSQRPPYQPRVRRTPSPRNPGPPGAVDWDAPPNPLDTPSRAPPIPYTSRPLALGASQPHPPSRPHTPRVQALVQSESGTPAWSPQGSRAPTPHLDIAGMQEEIDRVHENATNASRETLRQIFPGMDMEIMELVLEANEGDLGKSIEALLEMSSGT